MEIKILHEKFLQSGLVSTDTRKIKPGSVFVAIRGDKFNANSFAAEALEKGASYVVIDDADYFIDERTILVEDSLKALQQLATFHRRFLKLPIVSFTGSNGKTTTKELVAAVLSKKFRVGATVGNLNNHIGVPLTILSFSSDTEIGIVEMGANHQKEIEFLCSIALPDFGYITNFGKAHLEGFGGTQGVIKGKSELYDYLRENGKMAFVNLNDPVQVERSAGIEAFSFGVDRPDADVFIESVSADPFVKVNYQGEQIQSNLIGIYNANNINAAIAIGQYFGVDLHQIKEALECYHPDNNRSQMLKRNGYEIVLDAYNANPSSMTAALENFFAMDSSSKTAILGDMFELGDESQSEHHALVELASAHPDTNFIFVGNHFYANRLDARNLVFFRSFEDAVSEVAANPPAKGAMLIKGSRGMALERILEIL